MNPSNQADMNNSGHPTDTKTIVRDALVMQGKLVIDGLRDALLIPVTLIAAVLSLLQSGPERGRAFYEVVSLGRRSERWINLFAAADRLPASSGEAGNSSLDDYLGEVEARIMREYRGRELTRSARDALDRLVERIESARGRFTEANKDKDDRSPGP